ncbi:putative 3-deoxy-D-manno-octulosonic-acid transferase [Magnetofaba australis IT-1]|uniref:3-deoxy-D-manno-octulosonic acid transferase n=1 Tax=Magnetofaba australis IT-1 TaxID=1434232 RepID=A0A1Y2K7G0_9PROT|nr:putative 3-deoxy-D-manno-octulosonic-acid transferase [Magnetofaba australis IT-1]
MASRLGRDAQRLSQSFGDRPLIWLHAVSVGEAMAAQSLCAALKQRYPDHALLLSTVTKTGRQVVREKIPQADAHMFLPLDLPCITGPVARTLRPQLFIVMETELWPNLFAALGAINTPIIVVNGRLSPGSFKNYSRARWAMRAFLRPVTLMAMQSEMDAERMRAIGGDPARVRDLGNIKYDQALKQPSDADWAQLTARIGALDALGALFMAASTHPSEEAHALDAFAMLQAERPQLRLILAPRHPERCDEVAALVQEAGFDLLRLSQAQGQWRETVLLVDQVGWLTRLYKLAQAVFMGGSLIPHGGQNMLEPAAWAVPTLYGPHTSNFKGVSQQLDESGGAFRIQAPAELAPRLAELLDDAALRQRMGAAARDVVERNAGALERVMAVIEEIHPHG